MLKNLAIRSFGQKLSAITPRATKLLINGQLVNSSSGETLATYNPATEEKICDVQKACQQDVENAVQAARNAFENGSWRRISAYERSRYINKLADLIEQNLDELIILESMDNGKPVSMARALDFGGVLNTFRYYAGIADKIHGSTIPITGRYNCYTRQEPVGVCASIIPWNFPALMLAWKLAPALAAGCTVVLKPAEQTPLTALRIGELILEAGLPEGVVNIVVGDGPSVGRQLAQHHLVDKVAFTGSTEVGYEIMRSSHVNNLKRITLELGGKSPVIINEDADIDNAVAITQFSTFGNSGQSCVAGQRVFVHEKIYDEFLKRAVQACQSQKVGDPLDVDTEYGPVIDNEQFTKIMKHIETAQKEGGKLLTGGKRIGNKGFFIEPALFADLNDDMTIVKEEVFGPVQQVLKFKTLDEAIQRANNTNYGLGAGIISQDCDVINKFIDNVKAGSIYANCYDANDASTPFGGFKDSGIGRELGERGISQYLETKTVIMKKKLK
ncbi:betaine-aldehyde dehydrogenase [Stylonychia lemnae]|uniref:Betaine-aldehyde dehydrogenase n=1 Tax=Stylonychia lemnae TaxID=5949 RepID=A0A077ZS59_STYLE|nr:betaine-aldehyde dehydrogenase [Stylonychia lemnae]|eukprot:CDW72210.1 betaine-aldehyde dehydrogenase [Stylonychia lemnae]